VVKAHKTLLVANRDRSRMIRGMAVFIDEG